MTIHALKTCLEMFDPIVYYEKRCIIRKEDDRVFSVGDTLLIIEWDSHNGESCRSIEALVTHVLRGEEWGLREGFALISFSDYYDAEPTKADVYTQNLRQYQKSVSNGERTL